MDRLSLFWKVCAGCNSDQIVGVGADMNGDLGSADVGSKTSQHLAGAKALHQRIQFGDSRGQSRSRDFMRLKLDQRASGVSRRSARFG